MQTIKYKSFEVSIKVISESNFLISNNDLANVCFVFEWLIHQTMRLNPAILFDKQHYIEIDGTIYWSKYGVIRLALLLSNIESIEFANFIEEDLELDIDCLDETIADNRIDKLRKTKEQGLSLSEVENILFNDKKKN